MFRTRSREGRRRYSAPGDVFYEPEGARITQFDGQDAGVTFLACVPAGAGQRGVNRGTDYYIDLPAHAWYKERARASSPLSQVPMG